MDEDTKQHIDILYTRLGRVENETTGLKQTIVMLQNRISDLERMIKRK